MKQTVLFRLDDICPQMNRVKFDRMKAIFDKYGVKPIIGVVPDCKDPLLNIDDEYPDFWQMIADVQSRGWTVAMHGFNHIYTTKSNGFLSNNGCSEFAGEPYEEQKRRITEGKRILESHGIKTDVFMAPSHSYDKNTLIALRECGFKYVTDGLTARPYDYMGLRFVPCIEAKVKHKNRFSCVCYHTNMALEARYLETDTFCRDYPNRLIDFQGAALIRGHNYFFSRIEEKIRFFVKYRIVGTIYKLLKGR